MFIRQKDKKDNLNNEILREMYYDWINNFLTVERFAEYYGYDVDCSRRLIDALRLLYGKNK